MAAGGVLGRQLTAERGSLPWPLHQLCARDEHSVRPRRAGSACGTMTVLMSRGPMAQYGPKKALAAQRPSTASGPIDNDRRAGKLTRKAKRVLQFCDHRHVGGDEALVMRHAMT